MFSHKTVLNFCDNFNVLEEKEEWEEKWKKGKEKEEGKRLDG